MKKEVKAKIGNGIAKGRSQKTGKSATEQIRKKFPQRAERYSRGLKDECLNYTRISKKRLLDRLSFVKVQISCRNQ